MKKLFFLTLLALTGWSAKSQITLEHTYPPNTECGLTKLAISGYKYYVVDSVDINVLKLYNLDHTLWKSINLIIPSNYELHYIYNVSETLFNSDNLVEVAYHYNKISGIETYGAAVTSEDGTALLTVPICPYVWLSIESAGSSGTKLFVHKQLVSSFYNYTTDVYSLPGQLGQKSAEISMDNFNSNAFPNPANSSITIAYEIPGNTYSGDLVICNINGIEIKRYKVDKNFHDILINTSEFPKGSYIYKVVTNTGETPAKKFIIE